MAIYFSFLALWGVENELKGLYVEKYKSVPQFLPTRDLKLFFQNEKYTSVKFCPY